MNTKTLMLIGGAALAYYLFTKKSAAAAPVAAPAPAPTQGLGAVMTHNEMFQELGSLGDGKYMSLTRGYGVRSY